MYNSFYSADTLNDANGDEIDNGFDIDVYAQVHRFIHVTDKKIFGANYAYNVLIPMVDKDMSIDAAGIDASESFQVGDIILEPLALFWYTPRWDAILAVAAILPTGDYDADNPAAIGMGYWSAMVTAGGTYFLDDQRGWSVSVLTRTLYNGEQDDTNITPGMEFVVEAGIGKNIVVNDKWMVRPGVSLAASWQISDDDIDGDNPFNAGIDEDDHKQVYGFGVEMNAMYMPWLLQANIRYGSDFGAESNAEGDCINLTFTKSF
ncbi:transporter [Ferrimonas lipolytica]|uniref:Transporter n=2 Tax=Ferrimonas lipolytica TaxID=2724191 RepID=A0A6H1UKR1_9GAMM|nr:transporter [Ferrimonas lipolytica]